MKLLDLNYKNAIAVFGGLFTFCTVAAQTITTVAGGGTGSTDGIPATSTLMVQPQSVVEDRQGNLYLAIGGTNKILKVDPSGIIHTYAGTGTLGFSGDGGPATAADMYPARSIGIDKSGNIYFSSNKRVRKVSTAGIISTFAGNGSPTYGGDGGPATAAGIGAITGIAVDTAGNIYLGGGIGNRIRKVDPMGIITTYAGNGGTGYGGDGGPATDAQFGASPAMTIDVLGNLFVADESNHRIRKIDISGIVTTIAGNGTPGYSGDGGLATAAQIEGPKGLAWAGGYLYIGERGNNVIRQVDPSGIITTIAGDGTGFYSGDGGPALSAGMLPSHLFRYGGGSLYLCDFSGRVRKITMPNNAPYFTAGALVTVNSCGAEAINIDTVLRVMDVDNLQPITWSLAAAPTHGTALVACNRISTGSVLTPSGMAYIPAVGYTGTDTFSVRVNDGGASDTIVVVMDIETFPLAAAIAGPDTICIGDTTFFSAAGTGTWSATGASVTITGGVSAIATGTAIISYTVSNFCGTDYSTHNLTILPEGECPVSLKQEPQNLFIRITPNPSDGAFTLSLPPGIEASITITNATGRIVKYATIKGTTPFALNVAPGIYFILGCTAGGVMREKMVIK